MATTRSGLGKDRSEPALREAQSVVLPAHTTPSSDVAIKSLSDAFVQS